MNIGEALILSAVLAPLAAALIALPRLPRLPDGMCLVGTGILTALAVSWGSQPCQSDAAGCAMQHGFEGMFFWAAAAPLAIGVPAAIAWRVVAEREARLKRRLAAFVTVILLIGVLGLSSTL